MAVIGTQVVKEFLSKIKGKEISLTELRKEFGIKQGDKSFDEIRNIMWQLAERTESYEYDGFEYVIKPVGQRTGIYKIIRKTKPVLVYGVERERKPPFMLKFPRDFDTGMEFPFAEHAIIREGDCVLIAGESNYGKTTMSIGILGENIDQYPALLGNEFTKDNEPTPRFLNRLDAMDWVEWTNGDGQDKFTLLPVYDDFAENIIKDKINIIDWINIETGEHYLIGHILNGIKKAVGRGVAIPVIQKSVGTDAGRGGQFTKDFADLELLIDRHGSYESRITVGKCKEYTERITGRSWAFTISGMGVKITNIREVVKCSNCYGFGYKKGSGKCTQCEGKGYHDKEVGI
jgi:hypothetical protein